MGVTEPQFITKIDSPAIVADWRWSLVSSPFIPFPSHRSFSPRSFSFQQSLAYRTVVLIRSKLVSRSRFLKLFERKPEISTVLKLCKLSSSPFVNLLNLLYPLSYKLWRLEYAFTIVTKNNSFLIGIKFETKSGGETSIFHIIYKFYNKN